MELTSLIIPILLLVVMYFLLIRPQQKRAKEHRAMINRVEAGQKITTTVSYTHLTLPTKRIV